MKKIVMASATILTLLLGGCKKEKYINESGNLVPKTVEQDFSLPSITVNGAKFHAEAFGPADSAIILVLHGGPASDYRYLYNCKAFATQGYRVVFYDQRGTGLSQRFPKSYYTSVQQSYDDINAIIGYYRKSASQKVFLLGHSWGGILASAYINRYPTAVNAAVVAEPGGLKWKDVKDYIETSRKMKFTSEALNNATYLDQFITGKENEHEILDYKYSMLASTGDESNIVGNEGELPQWRPGVVLQNAYFDIANRENPDWTTSLYLFTTKVLFVYSERNTAYGLAHAQKVSSAFPNVQLFKTLGAGHDMLSFTTGWNNTYPVMLSYFNSLK
jgi:proline iminopeptidase